MGRWRVWPARSNAGNNINMVVSLSAGPSVQLTPRSSLITCVGLGGAGALSTATMVSPPRGSDATTVRCPV